MSPRIGRKVGPPLEAHRSSARTCGTPTLLSIASADARPVSRLGLVTRAWHLADAINQLATEAIMNSLARAQARWDSMEPDDDSGFEEAASRWIEDKAENLVRGCDLTIRRRGQVPIAVNYDAFLTKVQDHLNQRQIDGKDDEDMFAQVVIAAVGGAPAHGMARRLLGHSEHPEGKLYEIAVDMVTPHAQVGLEAQAEDDDL